jgi:hypothetical protein
MKKIISLIAVIIAIIFGFWLFNRSASAPINNSTNTTPETNPDIKITYITPEENEVVSFPFEIKGEARGTWFFEASFPVEILNDKQEVVTTGIAQAEDEWMTENFVPWTVKFDTKPTGLTKEEAFIKFKKDNPSGEPSMDKSFIIPIRLK